MASDSLTAIGTYWNELTNIIGLLIGWSVDFEDFWCLYMSSKYERVNS
jgi:hypothetical protein